MPLKAAARRNIPALSTAEALRFAGASAFLVDNLGGGRGRKR